jgi:hypothetical protein
MQDLLALPAELLRIILSYIPTDHHAAVLMRWGVFGGEVAVDSWRAVAKLGSPAIYREYIRLYAGKARVLEFGQMQAFYRGPAVDAASYIPETALYGILATDNIGLLRTYFDIYGCNEGHLEKAVDADSWTAVRHIVWERLKCHDVLRMAIQMVVRHHNPCTRIKLGLHLSGTSLPTCIRDHVALATLDAKLVLSLPPRMPFMELLVDRITESNDLALFKTLQRSRLHSLHTEYAISICTKCSSDEMSEYVFKRYVLPIVNIGDYMEMVVAGFIVANMDKRLENLLANHVDLDRFASELSFDLDDIFCLQTGVRMVEALEVLSRYTDNIYASSGHLVDVDNLGNLQWVVRVLFDGVLPSGTVLCAQSAPIIQWAIKTFPREVRFLNWRDPPVDDWHYDAEGERRLGDWAKETGATVRLDPHIYSLATLKWMEWNGVPVPKNVSIPDMDLYVGMDVEGLALCQKYFPDKKLDVARIEDMRVVRRLIGSGGDYI